MQMRLTHKGTLDPSLSFKDFEGKVSEVGAARIKTNRVNTRQKGGQSIEI